MRFGFLGGMALLTLCLGDATASAQSAGCVDPAARCRARQRDARGCCPARLPRACASRSFDACMTACQGGDGAACEAASDIGTMSGRVEQAHEALIRACELGNSRTCRHAVVLVLREHTPETHARAITLLRGVCSRGHLVSCWQLGKLLDLPPRGAARDHQGAVDVWTRGCEGGSPECCHEAANEASLRPGAAADPAPVDALYERACQAAGVDVEALLRTHTDTSVAREPAVRLARLEAVDRLRAIGLSCASLGLRLGRRRDAASEARALDVFERSCRLLEGAMATAPCAEARRRRAAQPGDAGAR